MNVTRPLHALAVGLAVLGLTAATHATESGSPTTAFGVYDFGAGFTPPRRPTAPWVCAATSIAPPPSATATVATTAMTFPSTSSPWAWPT